jgi:hypothetical protein
MKARTALVGRGPRHLFFGYNGIQGGLEEL